MLLLSHRRHERAIEFYNHFRTLQLNRKEVVANRQAEMECVFNIAGSHMCVSVPPLSLSMQRCGPVYLRFPLCLCTSVPLYFCTSVLLCLFLHVPLHLYISVPMCLCTFVHPCICALCATVSIVHTTIFGQGLLCFVLPFSAFNTHAHCTHASQQQYPPDA